MTSLFVWRHVVSVQSFDALGAGRILVIEPRDDRRNLSLKLGADAGVDPLQTDSVEFVDDETDGTGATVAVEAVGQPSTIEQASDIPANRSRRRHTTTVRRTLT